MTVPAAVVGSIAARWVPAGALRLSYGLAMIALAALLFREPTARHGAHPTAEADPGEIFCLGVDGEGRDLVTADGSRYRYRATKLRGHLALSGGGAVLAGLISTGVGEATLPGLVSRCRDDPPRGARPRWRVRGHPLEPAGVGRTGRDRRRRHRHLPSGTHPQRASRPFFAGTFGLIGITFVAVSGLGFRPDALR